jgi:serine protease Do
MRDISQFYLFPLAVRRALTGFLTVLSVALAGLSVTPTFAWAQASNVTPTVALPDFTSIVDRVESAVVNIRTMAKVSARGPGGPGGPGNGQDPYEAFRHFFGPDFQVPGMPPSPQNKPGPRGKSQPEAEQRMVPRGVGSGFFISADGYILTNHHVVADASEIMVTVPGGKEYKAKVIGSDERTDVALLKIDAKGMTALEIGNPKLLKKGQWVLAIGSPFGLESTVTSGIVSAIGRDTGEYLPFIQTDVAVNPGNSGGPLLNLKGEVVGINSQIVSRSGGYMGVSLAIPIDEAMNVVEQLRSDGKVTRGRIGVQIGEVSKDVAQAIGLSKTEGALVSGVQADTPAEKGGVLPGDVILKFNNKPIVKWSDLPRIVGETKPGTKAALEVWRKGKAITLNVTVAPMKGPEAVAKETEAEEKAPTKLTQALGLGVVSVPAEMQKKLRIKGGVLVKEVAESAVSSGIAEDDIVLAVNDADITSAEQFVQVVTALDKTRPVGLMVRRGEQTQWLVIKPAKVDDKD